MKNNNFDLGNTFKNIIYFLLILIIILIGTIIFFVVKNNQMAKELSEYTCETDIMEQEGVYNFIDDCFPRAYSIVMDITWKEAYKELCKSAMEQGQMMDNAIFVRNFLDKKFKRIPYEETYIGEFAENHPIGKYLITTDNHITACVNGYVIDTWNCTNKKIEYIWKI